MTLRFDNVWGGGFALNQSWEPGLHCLLGGWNEGPEQVFALASGMTQPEHGRVTLDGSDVFRSPELRAQSACLTLEPWLPNVGTVRDALLQLQAIHAPQRLSDAPDDCLDRFGFAHLAKRTTSSLDRVERRAAVLCLALGLRNPRLLMLADPWGIQGIDRRALHAALVDASHSAIVLVTADRQHVAVELGAHTTVFASGRMLEAGHGSALSSSAFGCFRVTCSQPRELLAALVSLPEVLTVQAPINAGTLEVSGVNPEALSLALMRTALNAGIAIDHLVEVPAQLDVLQAAVRGRADGTYAAAYQAAWQLQLQTGLAHPQYAAPSGLQIFGAPRPPVGNAYSGRIDNGGYVVADAQYAGAFDPAAAPSGEPNAEQSIKVDSTPSAEQSAAPHVNVDPSVEAPSSYEQGSTPGKGS